jgi:hypothetical protein
MWEVNGTQQLERGESEPLIVQMNPIFRSSDLQSNGHRRCDVMALVFLKLLQTSVKEKRTTPYFFSSTFHFEALIYSFSRS